MGVPVVTLPGRSAAGRHAQTHLTAAGLGEFVAHDADDYVAIIRRLALDRAHLAEIHAGLRDRVAGSALCDGQRFGRNLETLLRTEWRRCCAAALS
jgi:predicted O-linked N-acetylglucosamine transferase (SPINDLY family)